MSWVVDRVQVQAGAGKVFMAGSGDLTLGATGGSLLLSNPVGSGKKLYLYKIEVCSVSKLVQHINIRFNPTSNLPTTNRTIVNALVGGASSVASVKTGTSATLPSGGTLLSSGLHVGVDSVQTNEFPPIIIPPGNSVCIIFPAVATVLDADLYWYEDASP